MWAQLIKARVAPGKEEELRQIQQEISERSRNDQSGWLRTIILRNQRDHDELYSLIIFENEEGARVREQRPEQQEISRRIQACMQGPPEFVDFDGVLEDSR